jgi:hypothetical protein
MKLVVFLICSGIGYLLGEYLPAPWASYVSILVSYHLFLAWLVFTADHEAGLSMPVLSTVLTHAACLAVLIGLAIGRRYIPFLGLVRIFVPGLAPFECNWLFAAGTAKRKAPKEAIDSQSMATTPVSEALVAATPIASSPAASTSGASASNPSTTVAVSNGAYTADEHTAWIRYLSHPRRAYRKPGLSVGDEFKQWQAARAEYKALLSQNQPPE